MKDWGPGAPKVPLRSDEQSRDRKRAKRLVRGAKRYAKWLRSKERP